MTIEIKILEHINDTPWPNDWFGIMSIYKSLTNENVTESDIDVAIVSLLRRGLILKSGAMIKVANPDPRDIVKKRYE